jgi:GR25 family glycosyltransferase involved in LPS biosynthesis
MIDFFEKVLVINLPRDTKKYRRFTDSISGSSLLKRLQRFDAVDGKNLDIRIIENNILHQSGRSDILLGKQKRFGVSLTYGALGCALSHYLILNECSKAEKPYLIFEDDIVLHTEIDNELHALVQHIISNKIDFDLLYLGLHNIPSLNKNKSYDQLLYIPQGLTCGTWAMIISPKGAAKILDIVFPLSVQIDSEISKVKNQLKIFATKKELAKHDYNFGSSTQSKNGCITTVGALNNGHN